MTLEPRRALKATAMLLVFCLLQVYVGGVAAATPQGDIQGRLTTRHDQPVTVNGNSATTGQTILSGAMIDVPAGGEATVDLGALGSVEFKSGSRAELTFSDGQIKVRLLAGCVVVKTKQGTYGEINDGQKILESNDANQKPASTLDVCTPYGGAPGAVVRTPGVVTGGRVAVLLGGAGLAVLIGLALIGECERADNPSPSAPGSQCV